MILTPLSQDKIDRCQLFVTGAVSGEDVDEPNAVLI